MRIRSYDLPTLQKAVLIKNEIDGIKFNQISEIFEDIVIDDNRELLELDFKSQNIIQDKTLGHVVDRRITIMPPPPPPPMNVNDNKNIIELKNMAEKKLTVLKKNQPCTSDTKINFLIELEECIKKFKYRINNN